MDQHIVPTSPKSEYRQEHDARRAETLAHRPKHFLFFIIIFSLIFGAVSGFLGFLIASNIPSTLPVIGRFNIISFFEQQRETILLSTRHTEQSVMQQAPEIINQIAVLYSAAPSLTVPSDFLGNAVILTSDGWMVAPTSVFPANEEQLKMVSVVLADGRAAGIQKRLPDELTGLTFFRVQAEQLPVVHFDDSLTLLPGEAISSIEKTIGSYVVYQHRIAGQSHLSNTVLSTTKLQQQPLLDANHTITPVGSPLFYSNGNLAGILGTDQHIISSSVIQGVLKSISEDGKIQHSTAQLEYINVSRLTAQERTAKSLPTNGILITAVGAAEQAKRDRSLRVNDAIVSVNNRAINAQSDLAAIIHAEPAGAVMYIKVLRDGVEQTIEWTS